MSIISLYLKEETNRTPKIDKFNLYLRMLVNYNLVDVMKSYFDSFTKALC